MVRHINVPVDDDEYDALEDVKGERSWREALLEEFQVPARLRD
jgi:hypothetical protein